MKAAGWVLACCFVAGLGYAIGGALPPVAAGWLIGMAVGIAVIVPTFLWGMYLASRQRRRIERLDGRYICVGGKWYMELPEGHVAARQDMAGALPHVALGDEARRW